MTPEEAKREEAQRDRINLLLEPRGRDHFSPLEQADLYQNEALSIMVNDRRMLLDEVRRLRAEITEARREGGVQALRGALGASFTADVGHGDGVATYRIFTGRAYAELERRADEASKA
jgi:hypothetical protein